MPPWKPQPKPPRKHTTPALLQSGSFLIDYKLEFVGERRQAVTSLWYSGNRYTIGHIHYGMITIGNHDNYNSPRVAPPGSLLLSVTINWNL